MTPAPAPTPDPARRGVALGIGAYLIWGLLPLYLKLVGDVPPLEIVAHRVVWSLLLLALIAAAVGRLRAIRDAARDRRTLAFLAVTTLLIAVNWLVYTWAVVNGHVLEASLGYFINPLVNVALGFTILGERLRPMQTAAVGLAATGVMILAIAQASALWISLALAFSFGLYGLLRKMAPVDALAGLAIETALLAPVAIVFLLWTGPSGAFGHGGATDLLLVGTGIATTLPLLMFAAAARRLRYTTLGLLQYIAPTLQFLEAVLLFDEPLTHVHAVTFALIWTGLALYAADGLRGVREARRVSS